MSPRGLFIVLEGPEGSGKSTLAKPLADRMRAAGTDPVLVREPGGTRAGEIARQAVLDPEHPVSPVAELFLYLAARAELVATVIGPALKAELAALDPGLAVQLKRTAGQIEDLVAKLAEKFARRLEELASHPLVGDARSVGLLGAIELMADGRERVPFAPELKVGARVVQRALEQGVILRPLVDTISFCPPLIIRPAEIDFLFDVVGRALDQVAADLAGQARAVA